MSDETQDGAVAPPAQEPLAANDAFLEKRLAEPILKGDSGIDAAQVWIAAFLIVAVGAIVYSNAIKGPFHAQDLPVIVDNAPLHTLTAFPDALERSAPRPLTMLTYALDWRVAPGRAAPFHAVNIVLHIGNGVLLFLLCRRLFGKSMPEPVAMLAGMLLVLHPLATESVNLAAGRSGLLAAAFSLASLLFFLSAKEDEGGVSVPKLALAALGYLLAWASDETAIVLPLFALALDHVHGRSPHVPFFGRLAMHLPYWALFLILAVLEKGLGYPVLPAKTDHALAAIYYPLLFNPSGLSPVHVAPLAAGFVEESLIYGLLVVTVFALSRRSVAGFALLWFLVAFVNGGVTSEGRMYYALAGAVILVPWLFSCFRHAGLRAALGIAAAALVLFAGFSTHVRNLIWQDDVVLWLDAAAKAPQSAEPPKNIGRTYLYSAAGALPENAADLYRDAEHYLGKAKSLNPGDPVTARDLGVALLAQGRGDDARDALFDALRLNPSDTATLERLAEIHLACANQTGDASEIARAIDYYARADALKPLEPDSRERYAMALVALGDFERAQDILNRATGGNESSPLAPFLKNVQENVQRIRAIDRQTAATLAKDPANATALKGRAQALALRGQVLQAAYTLEPLLRANPQDFALWQLMGYTRAKMRDPAGFLREWPDAPRNPANAAASPWIELAKTCAASGLWDAAETYLDSAPAKAESGVQPAIRIGEIALQLKQTKRAAEYFRKAADAAPADPLPWLDLADLAIDNKDPAATQYLDEAQKRGAAPEDLAKRRERLGVAPANPNEPTRTIIR